MGGRFDPVRDSVTRSPPPTSDERRSLSISDEHAIHQRKSTRSASIADILNDGGSNNYHDSSLTRSGSGSNYGDHSNTSNHGYYNAGNHAISSPSQLPLSGSGYNQRYMPSPGSSSSKPHLPPPHQQGSPSSMIMDLPARGDIRHGGVYDRRMDLSPNLHSRNSPPTSSAYGYNQHQPSPSGSHPAPHIRTERSPSLQHLLHVNNSLDENRRPSSAGSSNHGLGPPYAGNHVSVSPTIPRPSRLSSEHGTSNSHLRADSMEMHMHQQQQYNAHHQHPHHYGHHPQDRSSSIRASSSSGSGEFAVPEVPYRSPESMRGRVPLPPTGAPIRGSSPYGHPSRASPLGGSARYPEHDGYGRPIPSDYLNERPPPGRPITPPHQIQQHYDRQRPPHHLHIDSNGGPYPYSQSPVGVPQTPYSNVAVQSPIRPPITPGGFAPTPGEHFGTPFFGGGRYPEESHQGNRNGPDYGEHEINHERAMMAAQDERRIMAEQEYSDRVRYDEERRVAYDRAVMEEEQIRLRQMQEREGYERQKMMIEEERRMEDEKVAVAEAEAQAEAIREEQERAAKLEQENKNRPSPPPPKKRKSVVAISTDEKKKTQKKVKEISVDVPPIVPSNGVSVNDIGDISEDAIDNKNKKEKQSKKKFVKNAPAAMPDGPAMVPVPPQHEVPEAKEEEEEIQEIRKPAYKPTIRVSRPGTVRLPITVVELDRLRTQCKNTLRFNWEDQNSGKADGWELMIAEIESSKSKRRGNGQKVDSSTSAKKRKRVTDVGQQSSMASTENESDNPALVAAHYNSRADAGREARKQSPIINLKTFNNWIKSVLIQQYGRRGGRVFDIGGGKGGDLKKWEKCGIEELILADIAEISVQQAKERYFSQKHRFKAEFFALDCFGEEVGKHIPTKFLMPLFDTVSLQFCLHYGWDTISHAEQMLENISNYLKIGGTFIATFPDCDELRYRLNRAIEQNPNANSFGNYFYNVKFENVIQRNQQVQFEPFGQKYTFELIDAIDNVAEYVVDWKTLEDLARQKYGLRCIYHENFAQVWNQIGMRQGPFRDLARRFGIRIDEEIPMNSDLWEAVTIYAAVAFEKE